MNKEIIKNILIVLLLTIAVFSIFKYKVVLNEKYELSNTLSQVREQAAILEKEKQNLLQDIEKRKGLEQELKAILTVGRNRLTKLFAENNEQRKAFDELNARFSLSKIENAWLKEQKEQFSQENESLKAKLNSIEELKKAITELSEYKDQAEEGNKGFLIKDGQSTYPVKVKIEVVPASQKE